MFSRICLYLTARNSTKHQVFIILEGSFKYYSFCVGDCRDNFSRVGFPFFTFDNVFEVTCGGYKAASWQSRDYVYVCWSIRGVTSGPREEGA